MIYIVAFVYFGAFWAFPSSGTPMEKMTYLAEHQVAFSMIYFLMYVVFGVFLSVLVLGLYHQLKSTHRLLVQLGSVFGFIWVVLVIASGMLANVGLAHAIEVMDSSVEKAFDMWTIISVIIESLGGGNELVGGLWVLFVSLASLKSDAFPNGLSLLGITVGSVGVATVYPAEVLTEIFGVTQIIWFAWLGGSLLSQSVETESLAVER
nr:hypothetical protein [Vibrio sp. JPW-9-11-11]